MTITDDTSFAARLRAQMEKRSISITQLAQAAELDQSIVSRLAATTPGSRREPRIEHIFALGRALGMTAGELVEGTDAAGVLAEWVPRAELEAEAAAAVRTRAQATELATANARMRQQVAALEATVRQLHDRLGEACARADNAVAGQQAAAESARVTAERARAMQQDAAQARLALRQIDSKRKALEENYRGAQNSAAIGWMTALFAGVKLLADDDKPPARRRRRKV